MKLLKDKKEWDTTSQDFIVHKELLNVSVWK